MGNIYGTFAESRVWHPFHSLNLARWRIQTSSRCTLCNSIRSTAAHILNCCPTPLKQGRYILGGTIQYYPQLLHPSLPPWDQQLYTDLPGCWASDSPLTTILVTIISTIYHPCSLQQNDIKFLHGDNHAPKGLDSAQARKQLRQSSVHIYSYWMT